MVSVIIPALNEEGAILDTIERVRSAMAKEQVPAYEVIVVNDGSTDRTAELAERCGATVISHLYNLGYGRSLKDGIREAAFDTILIVDADGTYPLEQIPTLLKEYRRGFDMVVGRRSGPHYRESWIKLPLRMALKIMVEFTAGQRIPDINSGMRVFSKSTIVPYFDQLCNTFSWTTSVTLAYLLTGKFVGYVPIEYRERVGRPKVRLFRDALRTLQYIVQAALYYNPIKIFLLFTMGTLAFSLACFLGAFALHLTALFLLGVGGILVSLLIFSMGLLSDQLRQVLLKIGRRSNKHGQDTISEVTRVDFKRKNRN